MEIDSAFWLNYFWTLEHKGRSPYCFQVARLVAKCDPNALLW